jgi:hypothetical protein
MRRDEVQRIIREKLEELGVPTHVFNLRAVPANVELTVLLGNERQRIAARSGITRSELNEHLRQLENWWANRQHQVDLEEAVKAKEPA